MGWNGASSSKNSISSKNRAKSFRDSDYKIRMTFAAGLVLLLLIVLIFAYVFLACKNMSSEPTTSARCISTTNVPARIKSMPTNHVSTVAAMSPTLRFEDGIEVISENVRTNRAGAIIERLTLADGRLIEKIHPPKPLFDNAADQLLAIALSTKPGQSMPPLPDLSNIDRDFQQSLLEPISITANDTEENKSLKLAVKEARAYIAAEIKSGRSVQDCLNEHLEQMNRISDSHLMAYQEISRMKESGACDEDILAFRTRINEIFSEKGLPCLDIPSDSVNKTGALK